jgi:hypothetical protein
VSVEDEDFIGLVDEAEELAEAARALSESGEAERNPRKTLDRVAGFRGLIVDLMRRFKELEKDANERR